MKAVHLLYVALVISLTACSTVESPPTATPATPTQAPATQVIIAPPREEIKYLGRFNNTVLGFSYNSLELTYYANLDDFLPIVSQFEEAIELTYPSLIELFSGAEKYEGIRMNVAPDIQGLIRVTAMRSLDQSMYAIKIITGKSADLYNDYLALFFSVEDSRVYGVSALAYTARADSDLSFYSMGDKTWCLVTMSSTGTGHWATWSCLYDPFTACVDFGYPVYEHSAMTDSLYASEADWGYTVDNESLYFEAEYALFLPDAQTKLFTGNVSCTIRYDEPSGRFVSDKNVPGIFTFGSMEPKELCYWFMDELKEAAMSTNEQVRLWAIDILNEGGVT